ncbi:hypothetical protein [Mucilaginibacter sp.]
MYHNYNVESRLKGPVDSVITTTCFINKYGGQTSTTDVYKCIALYDKKSQLVVVYDYSYYDFDGGFASKRNPVKTKYTYDVVGNLTQLTRYFASGKLWTRNIFIVNNNEISEKEYYCVDNKVTDWDTVRLDVYGKNIERDDYSQGLGLFSKSYFKYDLNGKQIEEDCYRGIGSLMFVRYCKYDEDGNLIEDQHPNGDSEVYKYTYENYDKMHNWTIQTKYIKDKPYEVIERHITYY